MEEKNIIPIYQVDAFTELPFLGNPAAVCILHKEYNDCVLQDIATEMNLSETAFLSLLEEKSIKDSNIFSLRWFTPKVEVPLCGHATLATAKVLFDDIGVLTDEIIFKTLSGELIVKKVENGILLNLPADEPIPVDPPLSLLETLGIKKFKNVASAKRQKILLVHLDDERTIKNLKLYFERMKSINTKLDIKGIIVTSSGSPPYDFVSRFFAPWVGINEDPVTGAAHTVLTPYWAKILKKREMLAYQASKRGGKIKVRLSSNDRVDLIGDAVIVLKGELYL